VIFRFLFPFIFPGSIFLLAGAFLLRMQSLPQLIAVYLHLVFPLIFTITLLLALRFKHNRLVFALVSLGLALVVSLLYPAHQRIESALALLLPLNLSLILLLPEKRLGSTLTALYGSSLLLQGFALFWMERTKEDSAFWKCYLPLPRFLPLKFQPDMGQLLMLGIASLVIILCFRKRQQPIEAAFFWTVLISTAPFSLHFETQSTLLFFSLAVLTLLAGLLETSHNMAYRDELTGIPGRRALNETLKRLGRRYSLAMLDIDHFKKFNDQHGHDVGDQVLKMVSSRLARVGSGGRSFRYGGEEFAIIFPGSEVETVLSELEKLRLSVSSAAFVPRGKDRPKKKPKQQSPKKTAAKALSVTISIGVAEASAKQRTCEQVMIAADQALYRAKQQGRNRVCR